jgi:hexosaminidase
VEGGEKYFRSAWDWPVPAGQSAQCAVRLRLVPIDVKHLNRILLFAVIASPVYCQAELPLMPMPAKVSQTAGGSPLTIQPDFSASIHGTGASDARVRSGVQRALARLTAQTGVPLSTKLAPASATPKLLVTVESVDHPAPQKLGDPEDYRLSITGTQARLDAKTPLGAVRGLETLLQLVQPGKTGFELPAVEIEDSPRFAWRGLSFDVSRHFMSVSDVKRTLDGMAAVKLNVLHWHLSDDEGVRVESKRFPKLQQLASDGMYYTQAEVRELIAYARERGIRVIPEFDLPGHSTSWFAAYPELASAKGPHSIVRVPTDRMETMDPTKEGTYAFLDGFIGEMAALFPDAYFHVGGDEVDPKDWKGSPRIQAFMKLHKLANEDALQAHFTRRLQTIVTRHGKRMAGWDEILRPDIPKSILIQSWRGQKSLAEAAKQGYDGILSAGYYLDLLQPASQHYAVDPLKGETAGLSAEERKHVLGGEATMWEEIASAENIDAKLWPRLAVIAERLWSPENLTDVNSMYSRLEVTSRWLETIDLRHRSALVLMRQRLAGAAPTMPLEIFSSVLEPVKEYTRHEDKTHTYGINAPLNRLVDSIAPESDAAREFCDTVDRYLVAGSSAKDEAARLEMLLRHWSGNVSQVMPLLEANGILSETVPVATTLDEVCKAGLEALASLRARKPAKTGWTQAKLALLTEAAKPKADMLIEIVPGVKKLVAAAGR